MAILVVFLLTQGIMPSLYWLELIYYLFAAICLTISLAMITSVLNMLARDTRKLILACMSFITLFNTNFMANFTFTQIWVANDSKIYYES